MGILIRSGTSPIRTPRRTIDEVASNHASAVQRYEQEDEQASLSSPGAVRGAPTALVSGDRPGESLHLQHDRWLPLELQLIIHDVHAGAQHVAEFLDPGLV